MRQPSRLININHFEALCHTVCTPTIDSWLQIEMVTNTVVAQLPVTPLGNNTRHHELMQARRAPKILVTKTAAAPASSVSGMLCRPITQLLKSWRSDSQIQSANCLSKPRCLPTSNKYSIPSMQTLWMYWEQIQLQRCCRGKLPLPPTKSSRPTPETGLWRWIHLLVAPQVCDGCIQSRVPRCGLTLHWVSCVPA